MAPARVLGAAAVLLAACASLPVARRDAYHGSDADLTVTRIVHGSLVVDLGGTRVLVDPWFHSGFFTRQREPLGLTPERLPAIAAVLLSHGHGDRFDAHALRDLAPTVPEAVGPPALQRALQGLGFKRVTPLGWWERTRVGEVEVTAVPSPHSVPENGYVLEGGGVSVYVAGDARWFDALGDIAARFPRVDVAVLPIGGERFLGVAREMGPEEAARAAAVLDARRIIPVGYGERGLFPLRWHARHPTESFLTACAKRGVDASRVVVLEPGESWHYYR